MLLEWGIPLSLFPQRFVLPICRESHGMSIDIGILRQQLFEPYLEVIVRMNVVLQVCQAAKQGIEFSSANMSSVYPVSSKVVSHRRHLRETSVPYTSMVSKAVAQNHDTSYPTFQTNMLREVELTSNLFLYLYIIEVVKEFRKNTERSNLQCFPYRRYIGSVVFREMILNEVLLRTFYLFLYLREVVLERSSVDAKRFVSEPKSTMFQTNMMNDLRTQCNLNALYCQ